MKHTIEFREGTQDSNIDNLIEMGYFIHDYYHFFGTHYIEVSLDVEL